jgi:hypothetical protein
MKNIENELTILANNYEKIQREYQILNEELNKYRYDLEQVEKSDITHKERVCSNYNKINFFLFILFI